MRQDKQESQVRFTRRALLLGGVGAAAFIAVGARLYSLQVLDQETYRLQADDNQFNFRLQPPVRGRLLDRTGEPIAENRESYRLLIVREQAGDPRAALDRLAEHMPLSEARIEQILRQVRRSPRFKPVTIAEDLDWETFARINLHLPELPGITPDVGEVRTYPYPQALAHVTGYVQSPPPDPANDDPLLLHPGFRIGRTGVEITQEQRLRGAAGQLKVEVNSLGRVLRELPEQSIAQQPGEDVHLTIDIRAQRKALEVLDGQSAAAVSIDVETGELLSVVSSPSYDPNAFVLGIGSAAFDALNNNPYRPLFNKATMGLYAPASTIKGMAALAALQEGEFSPGELVMCRGSTRLGDRTFHCWRSEGHGRVDLHEAVKTSCDIYFYEAAARLGPERFAQAARRFGFGTLFEVGLDISRRADGLVPTPQWKRARRGLPWTTGDMYNTGIGQGDFLASPIQLAVMTARLATGRIVEPTLFPRAPGHEFEPIGYSALHLQRVREALRAVVHEPGGTSYWPLGAGRGLDLDGIEMAGKTGTAQVYSISAEERAQGVRDQEDLPWRLRNHGLFIGYAPADRPKYAVAVVVEHGGGGSTAAAIPARDILRDLIERDPARSTGDRLAWADAVNDSEG